MVERWRGVVVAWKVDFCVVRNNHRSGAACGLYIFESLLFAVLRCHRDANVPHIVCPPVTPSMFMKSAHDRPSDIHSLVEQRR